MKKLRLTWVWLMASLLGGCAFIHPSVDPAYQATLQIGPFDALVIPGYPAQKGNWNRVIKARVFWAKHLYETGVVKNIIFSGAATRTPYAEGRLMALYAEALGIPSTVIHVESEAQHTCENLYYAYVLAKQKGFKKLAVCSDPFQLITIKKQCREFDLPYSFLPVDFVTLFSLKKANPSIDSQLAYVEDFVPIYERYTKEEVKAFSDGLRVRAAMALKKGD